MLQRFREVLVLVLIALLPLHALVVTVGTRLLFGRSHPPYAGIAIWKEELLALILLIAGLEWVIVRARNIKYQMPNNKQFSIIQPSSALSGLRSAGNYQFSIRSFDLIDLLVCALVLLSIVMTARTHNDWKLFAYGFKYDLYPLVAFLALRRVSWSEEFGARARQIIIGIGSIVALYGLIGLLLPQSFFVALGYSDLHSLYIPGGPLAAFQQIGDLGIRRLQSTFSGPNQAGMWLLLPWSVCLIQLLKKRTDNFQFSIFNFQFRTFIVFVLLGAALLFTFSRAAWIAAAVIVIVALGMRLPRPHFRTWILRLGCMGAAAFIALMLLAPEIIVRGLSSRDHVRRPLEAIAMIMENPLGRGLGTAGPASNRVSDACVFLATGADASWAADRSDLCVFVGDEQVQPTHRDCACPVLPENWYLQLGVEMGVAGMLLFLALIVLTLRRLWQADRDGRPLAGPIFLAMLGVSIGALVLHAWEDAAVAYTLWMLAAAVLSARARAI